MFRPGKKSLVKKETKMMINKDDIIHRADKIVKMALKTEALSKVTRDKNPRHKMMIELIRVCSLNINALYSLDGKNLLAYYNLLVSWDIPAYTARQIVFGYWNYSSEYIDACAEQYSESDLAPDPCVKPMFEGTMEDYPVYKFSRIFRYSPKVILYHYYGVEEWFKAEEYLPKGLY